MPTRPDRTQLVQFLRDTVSARLGPGAAADDDADLFELGLDSVDAVEVTGEIEAAFGLEVDPALLFECRTVNRAVDSLLARIGPR